jgi:hypothetical protein
MAIIRPYEMSNYISDATPNAALYDGNDDCPFRRVRQVVANLASKGDNFLIGTYAPSSLIYGNLPGLNGHLEMKQPQYFPR